MGDALFLPPGQPAGLAAFAVASRALVSRRRFTGAELGPARGLGGGAPIDCVVSFDRCYGLFHFCIAHRWGQLAAGTSDQFRNIATVLAQQAMDHAIPGAAAVLADARAGATAPRDVIQAINQMAGRMRFYRHSLPWRDLAEAFCRVDMGWETRRFVDPDFSGAVYASLPALLRDATDGDGHGDGAGADIRLLPS